MTRSRMTTSRLFLIGLTLAGLTMAETAIAQARAPFDPGVQRERAPGVPMAPRPLEVEERLGEEGLGEPVIAPMPPSRSERHARNLPEKTLPAPDRNPPMPRPVPSIIAP